VTEGNEALLEACRQRKMKMDSLPLNLVETEVHASGNLDGLAVDLTVTCISGMPAESQGSLVIQGNLPALLAVLQRLWPTLPQTREISSPGRQSWPDSPRPGERRPTTVDEPER
jgi:hypothetical protein